MNLKTRRTIYLLIGIASILTIVSTVSYAYFTAMADLNPVESVINTATVSARFTDYGAEVGGTLSFGEYITKRFTIENTGTAEAKVKMYWVDLINTYTNGSLTYTLSYSENEGGPFTEVKGKTNVPGSKSASKKELINSLTIPVGKTYYYNLVITLNYLEDENQDADLEAIFNSKFGVEDINYAMPTALNILIQKANASTITDYNSGNKVEMYVFDHPEAEQTTGWTAEEIRDYRYIGNKPNNYIDFNDETWRIIGVFTAEVEQEDKTTKKEQLVKIIRDEPIGRLAWDTNGLNNWNSASLRTLLNEDYYSQRGNYTNLSNIPGLSETARTQVANVKWYLGGYKGSVDKLRAADYYSFERGNTVYGNNITSITQKVGLMYLTDLIYTFANGVEDRCFNIPRDCRTYYATNKSWLFIERYDQWSQNPWADNSIAAYVFSGGGGELSGRISAGATSAIDTTVQPSVYLSADVVVVDGDGSAENPYIID